MVTLQDVVDEVVAKFKKDITGACSIDVDTLKVSVTTHKETSEPLELVYHEEESNSLPSKLVRCYHQRCWDILRGDDWKEFVMSLPDGLFDEGELMDLSSYNVEVKFGNLILHLRTFVIYHMMTAKQKAFRRILLVVG